MGFAGSSAWISRERHIFLQSTTRVAASSRGDNVMCLRNVYRPSASEWVTLFPDGGSINRSSAIHVFRAVGRPVVGAPRVRSIERGPNHYNSLFSHSIFKRPSSFRTMASANPTSQSKVRPHRRPSWIVNPNNLHWTPEFFPKRKSNRLSVAGIVHSDP